MSALDPTPASFVLLRRDVVWRSRPRTKRARLRTRDAGLLTGRGSPDRLLQLSVIGTGACGLVCLFNTSQAIVERTFFTLWSCGGYVMWRGDLCFGAAAMGHAFRVNSAPLESRKALLQRSVDFREGRGCLRTLFRNLGATVVASNFLCQRGLLCTREAGCD